jgi:peptidyl-prolyl cis-trans isomerase SurA
MQFLPSFFFILLIIMTNKLLAYLSAGLLTSTSLTAQPLFTYGTKPVSKDEFLRAFEKNPDSGNRKQALIDYLPLYINYKLKVQDALDKKMDTLPNQQAELQQYRTQLEEAFINEKSDANSLVKEAFQRSQKDILIGHLFIGFDPKDSASVLAARTAAMQAEMALKTKQDFATVVSRYSTDENSKKNGGQSGWITAFSLPYNYENAIYNQPVGGTTAAIKGTSGYHIFKNIAERPAAGRVQIAQIMLVNAEKDNSDGETKTQQLADSLFKALQNGASFEELAKNYSKDRTSYASGGVLPEFGVGTYDGGFEEKAFALKSSGEVSRPFATAYGWHILKLLKKLPVADKLADVEKQIQQKVVAGNRTATAKAQYIQSQIPKMNFKSANVDQKLLWQYIDSSINGGNVKNLKVTARTPIFSFGKQPVTATEFAQFAKSARMASGSKLLKTYPELMEDFIQFSAEDYQRRNIDKIDPAIGAQLNEFRDANLLFEAMDNSVWAKASADSIGLKNYYQLHKHKYKWDASALTVLVTVTDPLVGEKIYNEIKAAPGNWRDITSNYVEGVIADSGRYEIAQLPMGNAQSKLEKGVITQPVKNEADGSQTFAYIIDLIPANEQRSFDEARGFVINDYQQVLEEKWLNSLKKKYPVKLNEAVWKKVQSE